jgi:hypothetical protein
MEQELDAFESNLPLNDLRIEPVVQKYSSCSSV